MIAEKSQVKPLKIFNLKTVSEMNFFNGFGWDFSAN